MKTYFFSKKFKYNGSQLRPLFSYENFKIAGPSIVSWIGPCDVTLDHMVDYEDKIVNSKIKSDLMLHFIVEIFPAHLFSAVLLQRLFAGLFKTELEKQIADKSVRLSRKGDDIFWGAKKLSISIASSSAVSSQIHFAVNIVNTGTPVKTCALSDWKVKPIEIAKKVMLEFSREFQDIEFATQKVKPL